MVLFQDDGEVRLYDLRNDIREENDLSAVMPDKTEAMRALSDYLSDVRAPRWQEGHHMEGEAPCGIQFIPLMREFEQDGG